MKHNAIIFFLFFIVPAGFLRAEATANADWTALQDVADKSPSNFDQLTVDRQMILISDAAGHYADLALSFIEKHPADPRRW